ncbi:CML34 [Symbiodinium natans]|uniref:CML34 protein n=1 Tax=Symbiodinium natans TaxID=878477 RepID=A0A812SJF8_9DINO|nr:CML34 [Symbiodinium natans]
MQEVLLGRGLGARSSEYTTRLPPNALLQIIPSLVRNTRTLGTTISIRRLLLRRAELEAFSICAEAVGANMSVAKVLGSSLLKGSRLEYLGMAKTASVMASQPMSGFLEQLPADKSLKFLDLSDNQLDESAALMLEYGLQNHPSIELLDVSTNPLGQNGLCSLLRLLSSEQCPELCNILLEDVQVASGGDVSEGLFDVDPSGQYSLDMAMPGQRTCFRLLLTNLAQLGGSRSQYLKSAMLTTSPKMPPSPYNVDGVRKKRGVWNVPTSGILSFVLSLNDFFLKDEVESTGLYSEVVERMLVKRKRTWKSKRKTFAVLQKVNSLEGPLFDAFLLALLQDFQLSKDQVMAVYMNQGDKAKETLIRMLPAALNPRSLLHAALNTDSIKDILDFERSARAPLSLNLENPTGHYSLRLEHLPTRTVVQKLLLLNRWQLHLWRKANLVDVSIDGKGKCLRNALLDGKSLSFSDTDWRIPPQGLLTFDFVALYRPPAGAKPIPIETWGNVLAAMQAALTLKKKGHINTEEDDEESAEKVNQAMWALRGISSRVWILSRQLRNLLCIFLHRGDRAAILCMMFLRCVDWPINGKCCQPKFTKSHWKGLSEKLGYMNLFPYGQPEMSFHTIDLAQWEQRRCLHTLVRLSNAEDAVNIKNPVMDKDANPNAPAFQPFVAGIPNSWAEWDNVPAQGIMQCSYNCAVDRQNLKVRRRLAATVGGWANLPDTAFDLWSCLEDVPPEVLKVVVFMIRNWKSTDAAFTALNTQPDNMLNHKEFVDGLAKAGCCRTRRPRLRTTNLTVPVGSRSVPGSPSGEWESDDSVQLDALSSVFRYLDTSHDGDISRREFETLERVWRELQQSMYELKNDLEIFYGSLTKAFEAIDVDESGAISFDEFRKCVEATQFDGPVMEIFMFVDLNGDQEIDGHEFFILEEYSHAPPLPDFTDAKTAKMARLFNQK